MKTTIGRLAPVLMLVLSVTVLTTCIYVWPQESRAQLAEPEPAWIVNRSDSICGLDDPRLLSNPALIQYKRVLDNTPEMKKMREQQIDPASPIGIQLRMSAVDRVRSASDRVRVGFGHCSVWKNIAHKDGRQVPDLTLPVLELL